MAGLTGKTLDHYRLIEQVGQGGMATVYRAQDIRTLNEIALKVLSPTISGDKRFVRRFRREAGLVVRLKHPNIVPVLDYGEANGMVYLVMPYIQGSTLSDHIRTKQLSAENVLRWTDEIAQALDFAHQQGIIHRDIKPSNVIISKSGQALLTDFGLARMADQSSTLTGSMLMGTPAFISPEQGRGQELDHRSDQYAFGILLFQILTGQLPFDGDNPMATVLKHLQDPVPRLRSINARIPQTVENIVLKSLAKNPENRFESVAELNRLFQAAMRGKPIPDIDLPTETLPGGAVRASLESPAPTALASSSRPRWFAPALIAVFLIAVLSIATALSGRENPNSPTPIPATFAAEASPVIDEPAAISLPSPTPQPTAVLPIQSADCPGISLIWLPPQGNQAQWLLDNLSGESLSLQDLEELRWPTANGDLQRILLGDTIIWGREEQSEGAWLENTPRSLPPQTSLTLTLEFTWEAGQTGYAMNIIFNTGCRLGGSW